MVTLKGIGGKTQPLQKAGLLKVIKPDNRILKVLCYVFDEAVGNTELLLLISMSAINKQKLMCSITLSIHVKGDVSR